MTTTVAQISVSPTSTVSPTESITPSSTLPSGTIFTDATSSATNLENKLIGPSYEYWKNIRSPEQIGMSSDGSALGSDVGGIIDYVQVLAEGGGSASVPSGAMGNKFFLLTGGTCKAQDTGEQTSRYIYVNNVPNGNIPFISSNGSSSFKGLIPGIMNNLETLNPFSIMQAFTAGTNPECQRVTLQTIDVNNNSSMETQYVSTIDLQNMNACNFPNGINPVTGARCNEGFTNKLQPAEYKQDAVKQLFLMCVGCVMIYIIIVLSKSDDNIKYMLSLI